jgi:hypothetical protein
LGGKVSWIGVHLWEILCIKFQISERSKQGFKNNLKVMLGVEEIARQEQLGGIGLGID